MLHCAAYAADLKIPSEITRPLIPKGALFTPPAAGASGPRDSDRHPRRRPLTSINGAQHAGLSDPAALGRLHHLRKQNGADRRRAKTSAYRLHIPMHQRALARTHHCEALTLLKRTRRGLGPQALLRAAKLRRCAVNEDGSRLEVIAKGVVEKWDNLAACLGGQQWSGCCFPNAGRRADVPWN